MKSAAVTRPSPPEQKITAPYGSWPSPITSDVVSGGTAVGRLFWLESRPTESGRLVIVKGGNEEADDVTPKEFSVCTVVQEYGGGAFSISGDTVFFSNYKDQRLYKQSIGSNDSAPVPLTPDYGGPLVSFADGVYDTSLNRFISVMEDRHESSLNSITSIVSIELGDKAIKEPKVFVSGNDFYAFPRLDPKGKRLAWIEWSHPNMPWDRSELWVGYISDTGDVYKRVCVAGGDPTIVESPTEPKWSDEGELFFVTDRKSRFWNLQRWVESDNTMAPLCSLKAEFAGPLWVFGMNSYEIIKEHKNLIACSYRQKGQSYLGVLDENKNTLSVLQTPFTDLMNITSGVRCLYVEGASGVHPRSIAKVTLDDRASNVVDNQIVWSSSPTSSEYKSYFSSPEFIEFPTEVPGEKAYAYYYPPKNPKYEASQEEKPPLLLKSHGYGREFREGLLTRWGIVDVSDCCSCAQFLVDSGKADGERLCITGGSAGGYPTLAALAFKKTFKAGASLYGDEGKVADYMDSQPEITAKSRANMIDWVIKAHDVYELTNATLYLTVNIIDRFLAVETVTRSEFKCVAMTAMHIASKYAESRDSEDILTVKEYLSISGKVYEHQHVLDTELKILGRLKWKLNVPTMFFYLTWFIKAAEYPLEANMENMVYFYAELALMNYETIRFSPSMAAAAAVYAARATLNKSDMWHERLEMQTGFKENEVLECAKMMVMFHLVARDRKHRKVIYEKYSSETRGAVALYEPAKSLLADATNTLMV